MTGVPEGCPPTDEARAQSWAAPTGVPQGLLALRNAERAHAGREAGRSVQMSGSGRALWSGAWVDSCRIPAPKSRPCLGSWASTASMTSSPTSPMPSAWPAGWRWSRGGRRPMSSTGWGSWPRCNRPAGSASSGRAARVLRRGRRLRARHPHARCGHWPAAASSSPPTRPTSRSWPRASSRLCSSTRRCCAASPGWTWPTPPSTTPPPPPSRGSTSPPPPPAGTWSGCRPGCGRRSGLSSARCAAPASRSGRRRSSTG